MRIEGKHEQNGKERERGGRLNKQTEREEGGGVSPASGLELQKQGAELPYRNDMSNKQKIVTLVTNIITGILGALAGYFGGGM